MWNSEFSPNKWVFEKSPNIHLLPSLIQIHPHFWCKYYYTKTLFICLFLYVEILLYLVGKVWIIGKYSIKAASDPIEQNCYDISKLKYIVEKSNFSNMKSAKTNHGLKTVFYLVLVVNI